MVHIHFEMGRELYNQMLAKSVMVNPSKKPRLGDIIIAACEEYVKNGIRQDTD